MSEAFDIIFAGGGTTACVVAGRLAAADPLLKILILEVGQHSRDVPHHVQPCRYAEHLAPDSATISNHIGKPSAQLNGRGLIVQCGRTVGGGSAVNFMFYVRGAASDYDEWATLGNKGWSFNELLPLIRKLETFVPIPGRSTTHGYSGPIRVSTACINIGNQFLDVAKAYDPDRPRVDDNNDYVTADAYSPAFKYVDPVTGRRSDAASQYLYPHAGNPNLTIMVGKHVRRVIIENERAVGIEYVTDAKSLEGIDCKPITVVANKLVVVSAGALGSPMILERSGIGARSVLERNNIPVRVDLPGVGANYQNHPSTFPVFYASDDTETMDDVWDNPETINGEWFTQIGCAKKFTVLPTRWTAQLQQWEESGIGKIAHNGIEAVLKLRPTKAQLSSAGPALQRRWETFFKHSPDKSMAIVVACAGVPFRPLVRSLHRNTFYVLDCILYPESTGSVHVTSGDNLDSPVNFDPNCLTSDGDIAQLILLYKFTRELVRRMPAYRGEVAACHPDFPAGSSASCRENDVPAPIDAPDIVYSDADDEAIEKFQRDMAMLMPHSLGTCAMKPRSQGGVVDARLNVYGVKGLKVADLSICPANVGNATYSTALLIGEKAAAIIAEDLSLKRHDE